MFGFSLIAFAAALLRGWPVARGGPAPRMTAIEPEPSSLVADPTAKIDSVPKSRHVFCNR